MCMTEQSELAHAAMDDAAEWGAKNRKVLFLRRVHELEPHITPNTTGSIVSDFAAFWSGVDWAGLVMWLLCLVIVAMFAGWGYQELSMFDWSAVANLMGVVR